jgi:Flp pilus assembly protein TadD
VSAGFAILIAGCATGGEDGLSGLAAAGEPTPAAASTAEAPKRPSQSELAAANKADPADAKAAIGYARELRKSGDKARALAVLERAEKEGGRNAALGAEHGLLALELGQGEKAQKSLTKAAEGGKPDWRVLSGLGTLAASAGRQQEAQGHFRKALEVSPDQPGVLNNLAMSYVLDGRIDEAEKLLRRAVAAKGAGPQPAQNLALVLALKGRREEALKVGSAQLPPDKAKANVAYLSELTKKAPAAGGGEAAVKPAEKSAE